MFKKLFQKPKKPRCGDGIANASFYVMPSEKSIGCALSDIQNIILRSHKPGSFVITDPRSFSSHLKRYLALPPEDRRAKYASNNWRRMHGYPLRRRNTKQRIAFSEEKFAWERFAAIERAGYTLSIVQLNEQTSIHRIPLC